MFNEEQLVLEEEKIMKKALSSTMRKKVEKGNITIIK